ncbi:hypothetical protein [Glycomyces paridis]|uniref:DUF4386 family protein n=1 Tax=Glycomyces paridis TaxID=2126555 RepID=A0A4S8P3K2_9ACTN|nr:hypothetical protein [Glycomyces paridis]THV23472.1 hypothetical protein E9998_23000 [Glycomyces paridis]
MTDTLARHELRLAAAAGWLAAAVILVNTLKRAEVLPTAAVTQLLAPLAQVFAIGLVIGLYAASRHGKLLTAAFSANLTAVAALVGVEFTINLVFAYLEPAQVDDLRAGPLGTALTAASILFVLATLAFVAALWNRGLPRVPLALYAVAVWPIGLRAFVPEIALQLALAVLAAAVAWLALALWRRAGA